ncbi:MAG: DUF192 domain-containing protein [Patescibacteria group bacterium]
MEPTLAKPAAEPKKKASPAVLAVGALVLIFAAGIRIKEAVELRNPVMMEATLRGRVFTIEIADTVAKRDLGLGERESLPDDHGMYFPFDAERRWVFWMKGMRFPIDIIWIRDGKVVDIDHSVPPPKTLPLDTFSPIEPADAVLEVNAGVAQEIGLEPGDDVVLRVPENEG